jgi:hypothetical protein
VVSHTGMSMEKIEIRFSRLKLIFHLILVLSTVLTSFYFLFLTSTEITLKIFGTAANIVLIYFVFWRALRILIQNTPELTADRLNLGFRNKDTWREVSWAEIKDLNFKKSYDGYRISRSLTFDKMDGERVTIILNDMDICWDDLQYKLKKLKAG